MISRPHFSGHETFPLRYTWLKKGVDATTKDPGIFSAEDALVQLGVGKNMVRAIRHWGLATGVLEEEPGSRGRQIVPSAFGTAFLADDGWDPYLEDPASIWLIHWKLASTPGRATTWYWLFNQHPSPEFTVDSIVQALVRLARENGWPKVTPSSLRRDVDCCVRTYYSGRKTARAVLEDTLDCPLNELRLIRPGLAKGTYILSREARDTLPYQVFGYALHEYMQTRGAQTIPLDDLMFQPGSPGRVFGLDENALTRLVELLSANVRSVTHDETAGLKQVSLGSKFDATKLLGSMYGAFGANPKRSVA
ncbi:MAG: DUF4007 family protein [Myxococcales bacterium]|nr:DUF4007 family protein [Myxococcales bacterium]